MGRRNQSGRARLPQLSFPLAINPPFRQSVGAGSLSNGKLHSGDGAADGWTSVQEQSACIQGSGVNFVQGYRCLVPVVQAT